MCLKYFYLCKPFKHLNVSKVVIMLFGWDSITVQTIQKVNLFDNSKVMPCKALMYSSLQTTRNWTLFHPFTKCSSVMPLVFNSINQSISALWSGLVDDVSVESIENRESFSIHVLPSTVLFCTFNLQSSRPVPGYDHCTALHIINMLTASYILWYYGKYSHLIFFCVIAEIIIHCDLNNGTITRVQN